MFSIEDSCPEGTKLCLKKRTYLKGFGERKDTVPILEDFSFGGILFTPGPSPDYLPVNKDYEELKLREKACLHEVKTGREEEWKEGNPRRHNALCVGSEIIYFPIIYENYSFQTQLGKYLWRDRCTSAIPDVDYIYQLRKSIFISLSNFQSASKKININRLLLNDSLYCIGWFPPSDRNRFIHTLANCLRDQNELIWLAAENARLLQEDGLRLLFTIAVTSGFSLECLHIWNFFRSGQLPIQPLPERSIHDPFLKMRTEVAPVDTLIRYLWREYIIKASYVLSSNAKSLLFNTALQCLENLIVLSVEYSFLTSGQGNALVQLGCIKNRTLRHLNLLYTARDVPHVTQRYISARAWKEACILNPYFKVNLVCIRLADYEPLSQILVPYIPLEGFYTSSGIRANNEAFWLGLTIRVLTDRYKRYLHRITFHICRPRLMVDFLITKILMQFPFLEEFEYRGPIDRLNTLEALFEYVLKYNLRIRKIHFYLHEDPCFQEPYLTLINAVYSKYESKFINKHIDFELKLCKM